jgi:CxxC motif-containing protein (DUF1111 family)
VSIRKKYVRQSTFIFLGKTNFCIFANTILLMKRIVFCLLSVGVITLNIFSCKKLEPAAPQNDQVLDGAIEGLSYAEKQTFLRGDRAFTETFTSSNGLGPLFVSTSCASCHAGDGKGHPFTTLTRFGQTDNSGNQFLAAGAPQLQNKAMPGYEPEHIPAGATFSKFTPPANTGVGYLDAVSDAAILAMADADDVNGDGISGVPNWVAPKPYLTTRTDIVIQNGKYIGRFGKKAGAYNLLQQTAGAYNQDMGITSSYEPFDTYSGQKIEPEVSTQTLNDVVFYLRTLKAPVQRNASDPEIVKGKELFLQADCGKCHAPELKTGASDISALAYKTFYPYTDLLMHDMGSGLDDNYTEGEAKTFEWKTPALWGLGLSKDSQGGAYYLLHDGRAKSIEEAIALHGGEAIKSREKYNALSEQEKKKMIKFLESL